MELKPTAIIIVNYKTEHLMPGLLASIQEGQLPHEVIILDNASTTASLAALNRLKYPNLHILAATQNLGFTGGINKVLAFIDTHLPNTAYFFLLNPDAELTPGVISNLQRILADNADTACVSPRILNLEGKEWYGGARIQFEKGIVTTSLKLNPSSAVCQEVDVFSGCAALFDRRKALSAGMFNEGLFMYYDEADFALKLRSKGYRIRYAPALVVRHDASYTTRNISFLKSYYMTRNKFIVFHRTMPAREKAWYLAHEFAYYLKNRKFKNAWYHVKGYLDFRRGRTGALRTA